MGQLKCAHICVSTCAHTFWLYCIVTYINGHIWTKDSAVFKKKKFMEFMNSNNMMCNNDQPWLDNLDTARSTSSPTHFFLL